MIDGNGDLDGTTSWPSARRKDAVAILCIVISLASKSLHAQHSSETE